MYQKNSLNDLTPISLRKQTHQGKNKPFCPSLFLNQIDSQPKNLRKKNYKNNWSQKYQKKQYFLRLFEEGMLLGMDCLLKNRSNPTQYPKSLFTCDHAKRNMDDLLQFQEIQTLRENTEMESINKNQIYHQQQQKISFFQTSHVIIDEFDNFEEVQELPTQRYQVPRRRTHLKQLTTKI